MYANWLKSYTRVSPDLLRLLRAQQSLYRLYMLDWL